jgi:hypothetical protein
VTPAWRGSEEHILSDIGGRRRHLILWTLYSVSSCSTDGALKVVTTSRSSRAASTRDDSSANIALTLSSWFDDLLASANTASMVFVVFLGDRQSVRRPKLRGAIVRIQQCELAGLPLQFVEPLELVARTIELALAGVAGDRIERP